MKLLVVDNDEIVNLAESGFESENALWDALTDEFKRVQYRSLGFEDWSNAIHEQEGASAEMLFSKVRKKYLVEKTSEIMDGCSVIEELWICDTKDEAHEVYNAYKVGYLTQKEEIRKFRDAINIEGVWLDAKSASSMSQWCMNVKYDRLLLIERLLSPNAELVKEQVQRCEALRERLAEVGLKLTEMYKRRDRSGNQRYYMFKFEGADGKEYEYERSIGRKYQNKGNRLLLDFLDEKWLNELIEQERANSTKQKAEEYRDEVLLKNMGLWADVDKYDETNPAAVTAPVSCDGIRPLFEYLGREIFPGGDNTRCACSGTIQLTRAWLEEHMPEQVLPIMSHIRKNGGYCDCEVLFNASDEECWLVNKAE